MRRSEIEQDIILWKWRLEQLLGRLTAFTPFSESSSLFAYDFSLDTSCLSLFFLLRTHTYISRYPFCCFFRSNSFLSLRVYRSIMGEIEYRAVFGRLETGGTRLATPLRNYRGDVEAKEGVLFRFN